MNKVQELQKIVKEIGNCSICKVGKSGKAVPGEGSPNAKVVFVGEAPGKTESLTGRPFVGRSGRYLRSKIHDLGFKDEDIFITSPVKYLPNKGTPCTGDIEHGRIHLEEQLNIIEPKILVLLGNTACTALLKNRISCTTRHGEFIDDKYFITVHPAAAMRFPKLRKMFEDDFKKLKSLLKSS